MIHVGVTGHRFLADIDKLTAGVDAALGRIASTFGKHPMAVLTLLAEGADRLVTLRIREKYRARIIAVLPLPAMDYANDFESEGSKKAFFALLEEANAVVSVSETGLQTLEGNAQKNRAPDRTTGPTLSSTREEAYLAAGRYVLDHCDVLVAVWDGSAAQGKGGTGEIAKLARQRQMPLAWVLAGNRSPGTSKPFSLGPEQGRVIYERFPDR